jgi:UDP-glucose:(heptosyl)LPS alpha-1,3-glucosyltransferase
VCPTHPFRHESRVKIALNIEVVSSHRGGAEKYAGSLARWLVSRGHEVHAFARECDLDGPSARVQFHPVRPTWIPGLRWLRAYRFARLSEQALRRDRFDLIVGFQKTWYQHAYIAVGGAHPATLACRSAQHRRLAVRTVWWLGKRVNPKEWSFGLLARRQFHTVHRPHVIAPSRMVADHFRRFHGVEPERIGVVYNALDFTPSGPEARGAFRLQHGIGEQDAAVLFVARNYALKGLEPLLESFAVVARSERHARLVVCGSARQGRYRRMARRLNIASRVLFLGSVPDVGECFAGCDAFAFPSFYDPCSLVVLEAMAAGLPVITTQQNGAGELLDEGKDGFVIDSAWNTEALSDRIRRLVAEPKSRMEMGARARRNVVRYTVEARQEELWRALQDAASDPRADPAVRYSPCG